MEEHEEHQNRDKVLATFETTKPPSGVDRELRKKMLFLSFDDGKFSAPNEHCLKPALHNISQMSCARFLLSEIGNSSCKNSANKKKQALQKGVHS